MSGPASQHDRAPEAARLKLRTLGATGLLVIGEHEPLLGPGKPLALITYLALTPGRRASREFLMDLLWADTEPERARNALRQVLFHVRRLLGEESLPGTEELTLTMTINVRPVHPPPRGTTTSRPTRIRPWQKS